jgi:predicted DCC family thiol-disulfide oxidoreductase YuxK
MNKAPVILFDGVCNLCNGAVQFVIKHDREKKFSFASLQSNAGQELLNEYRLPAANYTSFVLLQDGKAYTRSTAALKVARNLNGLYKLGYTFMIVPKFIRDGIYNWVSNNRYKWFGKRTECIIPTPELKERFLDQ